MRILIGDDSSKLSDEVRTSVHRLFGERPAHGDNPFSRVAVSLLSRLHGDHDARSPHLDLEDQPELASAVLDALGQALLHQGYPEEAEPLLKQALQIRQRLYGEDHPTTASSLISYARFLRIDGKLLDAENAARRALTINSRSFGGESLPVAISLNELAAVQIQQSDFTEAEQSAVAGLAILKSLRLDTSDPNATRLMDVLGRIQQTRGNYERAAEIYRSILELDRDQLGQKNIKYAMHLANLATVEAASGQLHEAERHFLQAIDTYRSDTHNNRHPDLIDVIANLGALLQEKGDLKGARQRLEEALKLGSQVRGADHMYVGMDYTNLGRVDHAAGDFNAAERNFSSALQILRKNVDAGRLPADHAHIAEALTWKGRALLEGAAAATRAGEAESLLEESLRILKDEFAERSIERAITGALLGRALFLQRKDPEKARSLLLRNYPIVVAARGADSKVAQLIKRWIDELPAAGPKTG